MIRLTGTVVLISVGTATGASFTSDEFLYGTWGTSPKGILFPLPVRYPHSCSLMVEVIRFRNWAQAVSDTALWNLRYTARDTGYTGTPNPRRRRSTALGGWIHI
jgi:hypothetical protein